MTEDEIERIIRRIDALEIKMNLIAYLTGAALTAILTVVLTMALSHIFI